MAYISNTDISRDVLVAQFSSSFSTYHTLVDEHIEELAQGEQVDASDIDVDESGYLSSKFLRRYAAAWVCMELFKDKMGINNNVLADEEKYRVKYEIYREQVLNMGQRISREMFINDVDSRMDTAVSGNLYRG